MSRTHIIGVGLVDIGFGYRVKLDLTMSFLFPCPGTYRFLSVFQQTSIVIGEPKHGVWRVQDNGFIREYRRYAHIGLDQDVDPNSGNLTTQQLELLSNNYASFLPG